jgi:hypothetical protein
LSNTSPSVDCGSLLERFVASVTWPITFAPRAKGGRLERVTSPVSFASTSSPCLSFLESRLFANSTMNLPRDLAIAVVQLLMLEYFT